MTAGSFTRNIRRLNTQSFAHHVRKGNNYSNHTQTLFSKRSTIARRETHISVCQVGTQQVGVSFIKSYSAVCLEGAIIVLACIIFSLFASSPPAIDSSADAINQVWTYVSEIAFSMLVLVGTVKMSDRVVREMMGL